MTAHLSTASTSCEEETKSSKNKCPSSFLLCSKIYRHRTLQRINANFTSLFSPSLLEIRVFKGNVPGHSFHSKSPDHSKQISWALSRTYWFKFSGRKPKKPAFFLKTSLFTIKSDNHYSICYTALSAHTVIFSCLIFGATVRR